MLSRIKIAQNPCFPSQFQQIYKDFCYMFWNIFIFPCFWRWLIGLTDQQKIMASPFNTARDTLKQIYPCSRLMICTLSPQGRGHSNIKWMGVRLTLPKAGAFSENTVSKNEGSLGETPNIGSNLGGNGCEYYFWSFSEHFKAGICKKNVENGKNDQFVNKIKTKNSFLW